MFKNKTRVIIGLTTYYTENLIVSLSGILRLGRRTALVIHNDNPDVKITKRQIRRMGYRGELHIINSQHNIGLLNSRLTIIDYVRGHRLSGGWFVFVDDDDILLNIDIPDVSDTHFAIIQNMIMIQACLVDVLRAMQNPDSIIVDGQNNILVRPHIGLAGTLVRASEMFRLGTVLNFVRKEISDITEGLTFRAPIDIMMWSALNIIARYNNSDVAPIYMDTVNYIATNIDNVMTKYGVAIQPSKDAQNKIAATVSRYDNVVRNALPSVFADAPESAS